MNAQEKELKEFVRLLKKNHPSLNTHAYDIRKSISQLVNLASVFQTLQIMECNGEITTSQSENFKPSNSPTNHPSKK